jgi:hypothetical protein
LKLGLEEKNAYKATIDVWRQRPKTFSECFIRGGPFPFKKKNDLVFWDARQDTVMLVSLRDCLWLKVLQIMMLKNKHGGDNNNLF